MKVHLTFNSVEKGGQSITTVIDIDYTPELSGELDMAAERIADPWEAMVARETRLGEILFEDLDVDIDWSSDSAIDKTAPCGKADCNFYHPDAPKNCLGWEKLVSCSDYRPATDAVDEVDEVDKVDDRTLPCGNTNCPFYNEAEPQNCWAKIARCTNAARCDGYQPKAVDAVDAVDEVDEVDEKTEVTG